MSENIREIVTDILVNLESSDRKSHLLIRDVLEKYDYLDKRDKAFIKRVSEGTITNRITLDYVIDSYSSKPVEKCKPMIRAILRMSTYQLLFMDKIPMNAVCDEAVKLCRKKSFEAFCPFVNGVLRNIAKNRDACLNFDDIEDDSLRLSIKYSMPEWIVKMLKKEQDNVEELLSGLLRIRPTCIKLLNPDREQELLKRFDEMGIHYEKSAYVESAYLADGFEGVASLPGFEEGDILVQDESSMLAAMATGLNRESNLLVIDTCAAPGGKTCFAAASMFPNGKVLSFDVSEQKVSLIEENVSRLKLTNVVAKVGDAREFNEELFEKADVVICDVPCSGLGIMGRKSDIRYNISNEAMMNICALQKEIVSNVSKYVKKGGILIYSTCTIHKAENEKMVKYILNNLPFKEDSLKPVLPKLFATERENDSYIQMLPNVEGTDGFFVARFRKNME